MVDEVSRKSSSNSKSTYKKLEQAWNKSKECVVPGEGCQIGIINARQVVHRSSNLFSFMNFSGHPLKKRVLSCLSRGQGQCPLG